MAKLGAKLQALRKNKGLTIEEMLAEWQRAFGKTVTKGMVSRWENNLAEPTGQKLSMYSKYFGVTMGYLLGEDERTRYYDDIETAELAQELHDNPDLHTLMNSTRKLSPAAVKEVQEFIKYQLAKERHQND